MSLRGLSSAHSIGLSSPPPKEPNPELIMVAQPTTDPACVVLFDGVCNLCHGAVQFIIDHDPKGRFCFASLQSEAGARVLRAHGRMPPEGAPDSIVLVEGARVHDGADAVLRIAQSLGFPWRLATLGFLLPRSVRDALYRAVARNRYRCFGRTAHCRVPSAALHARFLSS